MSGSRPEKYRYWLTYLLDDLPEGAVFSPQNLHITFIPWFVVEPDVEDGLKASFIENFNSFPAFEVTVGQEVKLGPREDISVFLLDGDQAIYELHNKSVGWFETLNGRWAVKNPYVNDEYKPHIRRRQNSSLKTGDRIHVSSITLVKALRRADQRRVVEAKVALDE